MTETQMRRLRLVYGFDARLPSVGADTEQVFNTVAAVERAGATVDLAIPAADTGTLDAAGLKAHYQVEGAFSVTRLGLPRLPFRPALKWAHALAVAEYAAATGVDAVHTRHLPVATVCVARGLTTYYETYRPWPDQFRALRPALRRLLDHPRLRAVIVHSEHTARAFRGLGARAPVEVVYNGYSPERMAPRLSATEARRLLDLPPDRPLVIYAGRIEREKGLDAVLEMARRCPEVDFLLVGSRGEGPVEIAGRGIRNLRFAPWQAYDATARYLYAADVLLIPPSLAPLRRHGNTVLPMKLFIYLAAGRVVVAPRAPDTEELLSHEDNALIHAPGDIDAAVAAVRRAVREPALAAGIAERARARAAELTWAARGRGLVALFNRTLPATA